MITLPQKSFNSLCQKPLSFKQNKEHKSINAMAPCIMETPDDWMKFGYQLSNAKKNGVDSVSVDVWWGKVEKEGDQKFDWEYYDKVFGMIAENDLKIVPIMSFHKYGGNVNDKGEIPIPSWAWNKVGGEKAQYKNEQDKKCDQYIALWNDDKAIPQYEEFMTEFKEHYKNDIGYFGKITNIYNKLEEVNISLGPTGELKYPAYGMNVEEYGTNATYPKRGNFLGYSEAGKEAFRDAVKAKYGGNINKVNKAWHTEYKNFEEVGPPDDKTPEDGRASDFIEKEEYKNTKYGKDFINWYHKTLMTHAEKMMNAAHKVFKDLPKNVSLGMKIPGVHWNMGNESGIGKVNSSDTKARISEITAGLISTDQDFNSPKTDYGYKGILDTVLNINKSNAKNRSTDLHFTCLEKEDKVNDGGHLANSKAASLTSLMLKGAKKRNLTIKGENALPVGSDKEWKKIVENLNAGYDGITFLRIENIAQDNTDGFENYKKQMSQFM